MVGEDGMHQDNTALFSPCTGVYWADWSIEERYEHLLSHYVFEKFARLKHTFGGENQEK